MPKTTKKHILWVEDDTDMIALYQAMVDEMPGVELEIITLGTLAIERVKEIESGKAEKPDLVLLDLLLPDINGDKILDELRRTPATRDIPVFILTNYGGEHMAKTEWPPSKLMPFLREKLGLR